MHRILRHQNSRRHEIYGTNMTLYRMHLAGYV